LGGQSYTLQTPQWPTGPATLPIVVGADQRQPVYMRFPQVRIAILVMAIIIGVAMWLVLNRTRLGMLIRAGVDDREMLTASGVRIHYVFLAVFGFGAGLAGIAGVVGHLPSLAPARIRDFSWCACRRDCGRHGVHTGQRLARSLSGWLNRSGLSMRQPIPLFSPS
jgi:ABC-type uncharacterized transport system permease subunit